MRRWARGIGMVMVMLLVKAGTASAQTVQHPSHSFVLRVDGTEQIDPLVLRGAREIVEGVYGEAGIRVEWRPRDAAAPELPDGHYVSVVIASLTSGVADGTPLDALGAAAGTATSRGTLAYVFYERVEAFARTSTLDFGQVLGHVIAHEVGHLLLPYGSHSRSGLMRATLYAADLRQAVPRFLCFDRRQAALMHARLTGVLSVARR